MSTTTEIEIKIFDEDGHLSARGRREVATESGHHTEIADVLGREVATLGELEDVGRVPPGHTVVALPTGAITPTPAVYHRPLTTAETLRELRDRVGELTVERDALTRRVAELTRRDLVGSIRAFEDRHHLDAWAQPYLEEHPGHEVYVERQIEPGSQFLYRRARTSRYLAFTHDEELTDEEIAAAFDEFQDREDHR